ncbi:SDR family oxidoreductase [Microvirga antarctica]|uniref:SDR family oxidoreductase n=1 Tax=Microvirga antarctica TaxID=2819233 RepID=UPI001B3059E6|nr:SDR family oxidoreductase [Microvirga antarctica]
MDLGLRGRSAIVSAASKGLSKACALSLAREGVDLVLIARTADTLEATAAEIRGATGVNVQTVAADIHDEATHDRILDLCPEPDILINNPGVRQVPGDFRTWSRAEWQHWIDVHFFSAIRLIQRVSPGMAERKFGRIVNMSVSFIKFPQVGFAHSHAARLALSGAVAAISRELIPHNVTINTVCPGLFDTDALHTNLHGHAERRDTSYEAILAERLGTCPAGRLADPTECGDLVAYLCSAQAGFMSAQNIVNDGGVYQGIF